MTDGRLVWCDIETFGLDREVDPILEIGFLITDLELNTITSSEWTLWQPGIYDAAFKKAKQAIDPFVYNMHTKNGLFDQARAGGYPPIEAEHMITEWLGRKKISRGKEPLCGSSVRFDREFLDTQLYRVNEFFHYRIIDISSLKELCRRYRPGLYASIPKKEEQHRVKPDLVDTVAEFKYYRDHFLKSVGWSG